MKKTQLYILTGFLGSGKTTLLLGMMDHLAPKTVGVIQNEFGKVNIDGEIIGKDGIEITEISRGSIFCSCLKLSFVKALKEMGEKNLDYLIVESSGLGDPSNVEEILDAVGAVSDNTLEFQGVICAVDAVNFRDQLKDMETVARQLKHCNIAVITKADLVKEEDVEILKKEIRAINPICRLVKADQGKMDYDFFHEDLRRLKWAETEATTNAPETKPKTLFMNVEAPVKEAELVKFLEAVRDDCLRIKGFVMMEGKGLVQVDVVGKRIDLAKAEGEKSTQLVFISKIGPALIKTLLTAQKTFVTTEMKLKN